MKNSRGIPGSSNWLWLRQVRRDTWRTRPNREIISGGFDTRPLQGTRWITVAGGRDPNPERDGIPGMKRAAAWLKEQGAVILAASKTQTKATARWCAIRRTRSACWICF